MRTMTRMPPADQDHIGRLLAAARETIATVRHCWVATCAEQGGANARAVRCFASAPGSDEWTRRFLTRRGSRKVAEIRRDPRITLAYQLDFGQFSEKLNGINGLA
jgi:general stress protein 26